MPRTPRIFALLSGLFCAAVAGLAAYLLFGAQWGWDVHLDHTVYKLRQQFAGEPWMHGALIGVGVTGALGALASLLMTLRPGSRMLRYPIEHGQVLIPLPVVRQVAEEVLASHPEVINGKIRVLHRRKGPDLALKLRVLDSAVFSELSDTLRRQLKTEIGARTGVIVQDIRINITVAHDSKAEILPPDVPDRERVVRPSAAPDLSEIDLNLGIAENPQNDASPRGEPTLEDEPAAPEPPPQATSNGSQTDEPVAAPEAQHNWSDAPPQELEPTLPKHSPRWAHSGKPDEI